MPNDHETGKPGEPGTAARPRLRRMGVIIIVLVVGAYTLAVVTGTISSANRIGAVELGLIALAGLALVAVLNPRALTQVRIFELGSVKLELREIKSVQSDQQSGLDELRLVLSILLPEGERAHLRNLLVGATTKYKGGWVVRTELRHLRSLKLIRMRNNHAVEEMRSDMTFDLRDYVELTYLGERAARMIKDAEDAAAAQPAD